ncbi:cuticle protein 76-like [Schistocerca americana]|uniref:cuticle protein 76-like n=1 Tax=Schistocerca americana TaxID=7009 RepID=UPI001F4F1C13|nr:cuticle protein 76-like [Schistocerca americana]XP_047110170.1 cuticle protein 76-like [Schistocerca piceifrons]XP_049785197.1 cuticle protein 76-like [Schistocerca cancellata]XP_049798819.1 cuticle protein 76-like [Schistocerca nitens]XP_049854043.1 cuticle protein 76-like [Schistocerca gregaria]XP_049947127.1 cuticle protein 76-like [Schistocerca serialis cubense]
MAVKVLLVLSAALVAAAHAQAGALVQPGAITSQQSNILRSFGNLGQTAASSKTIETPYSSVRKADVRVSNDAIALPGGLLAQTRTAPAAAVHAGPPTLLGVAYSAAPAVAHMTYTNGLGISYAY